MRIFYAALTQRLIFSLPAPFRPAYIRALVRAICPEFESIFEKHVKNAKFRGIPSMDRNFKALKLGILSLWHLQRENKRMRPEHHSELIRALVVEHNFQEAFQVLQKSSGLLTRVYSLFRSDPRGAESFKIAMQKTAAPVSDSEFLQMFEDTEEDLRSAAQTAKALALAALSSSIDGVVKKLTNAVLVLLRGHGEREVRRHVDREENKVLAIALVGFIREINNRSAGGKNS